MIQAIDLTLAGATLSGGARLAASGSGLPQRLTTEADAYIDLTSVAANIQGGCFTSDGTGDVVLSVANNTVKRYNAAGSQVWSAAASNNRSAARGAAGKIISARSVAGAATFLEIDEATGTPTSKTYGPAATFSQIILVPGGTADRAWTHALGTVLTEIVYSTGAATGRTISGLTGCSGIVGSNWDGTASIYIVESTTKITRYNESTLALMDTWSLTLVGGALGIPGGSFGVHGVWVDSSGRVVNRSDSVFAIDRFPAVGGTNMQTNASVERLVWPSLELAGPQQNPTSGGQNLEPSFDVSPNGRYLMFIHATTATVAQRAVTVRNIQTQTVEWSQALSSAVALSGFSMPGNLGNKYGVWPLQWHSGTTADLRNSRGYYQRVGIDGAIVYMPHGIYVPPAGLSLVGATSLKLGVEFDRGLGKLLGPEPYIGGPSGEGPRLWIEQAPTLHRNRRRGAL